MLQCYVFVSPLLTLTSSLHQKLLAVACPSLVRDYTSLFSTTRACTVEHLKVSWFAGVASLREECSVLYRTGHR